MTTEQHQDETRAVRVMAWLARILGGGAFPLFALVLLGALLAGTGAMLFVPVTDGPLGQFAEDFKVWCFGWDPLTGDMESAYVASMLLGPLPLMALLALFWWTPIREDLRRGWRSWLGPVSAALSVVVLAIAAFLSFNPARAEAAGARLEFPAVDLRTHYAAPDFTVTDHAGRRVTLSELRGKVVLVTAIYSRCSTKCPMIMAQAKQVVASLPPEDRADLRVIALSLDPAHDTVERLAEIARGHMLDDATWSLATGEPSEMEGLLDRLGFARTRDPVTGVIDHATLFLLIDRQGRLAYRMSLGERQQEWTLDGLKVLLHESA